jgi:hypothetical protein
MPTPSTGTYGDEAATAATVHPALLTVPPADGGGPRTTEFWITVGTNLIGLAVAVASIVGRPLDPAPFQALIPAAAVLAAAIATAFYSHSRATTKRAQLQASAQVAGSTQLVTVHPAQEPTLNGSAPAGYTVGPAVVTSALNGGVKR